MKSASAKGFCSFALAMRQLAPCRRVHARTPEAGAARRGASRLWRALPAARSSRLAENAPRGARSTTAPARRRRGDTWHPHPAGLPRPFALSWIHRIGRPLRADQPTTTPGRPRGVGGRGEARQRLRAT